MPLLCGNSETIESIFKKMPLLNDKSYLIWDGNSSSIVNSLLPLLNDELSNINVEPVIINKSHIYNTRWLGLLGGVLSGIFSAIIYYYIIDNSSIEPVYYTIIFLTLVGFMLGLFYEKSFNISSSSLGVPYVLKSATLSALAVCPIGAFSSKIITDDCFQKVQQGFNPDLVCRTFAGESLLVFR